MCDERNLAVSVSSLFLYSVEFVSTQRSSSSSVHAGPPSLERVTPRYTALTPSDTLVLEVQATGYRAITWVVENGTAMHDFPRVELEDFSKRFILNNASVDDFGRYEVDLHTVNGSVLTVEFFVDKYSELMETTWDHTPRHLH